MSAWMTYPNNTPCLLSCVPFKNKTKVVHLTRGSNDSNRVEVLRNVWDSPTRTELLSVVSPVSKRMVGQWVRI